MNETKEAFFPSNCWDHVKTVLEFTGFVFTQDLMNRSVDYYDMLVYFGEVVDGRCDRMILVSSELKQFCEYC